MDGFIIINKPLGISSFDVIRRLRKIIGKVKMGHTGTLDPLASGVLPIALGNATKRIEGLPKEKEYVAEILLGVMTTTDDREGESIQKIIVDDLAFKTISEKLNEVIQTKFTGKIRQKPPIFSAIHINGKRAYDMARKNEGISLADIPEREVDIYEFEVLSLTRQDDTAILKCRIACGGGTYIRSIARDLGNYLGVGGSLFSLVRTKSGGWGIEDSIELEELEKRDNLKLTGESVEKFLKSY
jgi:tRNA pseudouridine55 synthase